MRVLPVVMCLAGCNEVYGLGETRARDAFELIVDDDNDMVADDDDNCPFVANTDQQDADGDGKGDACDTCAFCAPCAAPPEHDEDGDRIADGCDNCPGVANAMQTNGDNDDLGDACDPSAATHRRLLFDGFAALASEWLPGGAPWTATNDSVAPMPGVGTGNFTLRHANVRLPTGTTWFVEVGIEGAPVTAQGIAISGGLSQLSCQITNEGTSFRLNNSGISDQVFFALQPKTRLRYAALGMLGTQDPRCEIVGGHGRQQGIVYNLEYPLTIDLVATGPARFAYIDVIGP